MRRASILVALLTPFDRQGVPDLRALRTHARHLLDEGVDGFLICGTTGEGPLLDEEEVMAATRVVAEACDGRGTLVTQVGRPATAATIRLLERARDSGSRGAVVVAPYYYELEDGQIEAHYAAVLAAMGDAPLYAYAIPRCTGNDLRPDLVRRLAERGLAGIKDSTRSLERHRQYRAIALEPGLESFGVHMGSDVYAFAALEGGSSGVVSGLANLRPDLFVGLRRAVEDGRAEEARRLQGEIDALRASIRTPGTIPGLKAAVARRLAAHGVDYPAHVRAPLTALRS